MRRGSSMWGVSGGNRAAIPQAPLAAAPPADAPGPVLVVGMAVVGRRGRPFLAGGTGPCRPRMCLKDNRNSGKQTCKFASWQPSLQPCFKGSQEGSMLGGLSASILGRRQASDEASKPGTLHASDPSDVPTRLIVLALCRAFPDKLVYKDAAKHASFVGTFLRRRQPCMHASQQDAQLAWKAPSKAAAF